MRGNAVLRAAFAFVVAVLGVLAAPTAAAVELALSRDGLSAHEADVAGRVADGVVARLPAPWRDALGRRVRVEWRDDLPADVHGRAFDGRVLIRRDLLASADTGTAHPAAVALAHELAHLYDRSPEGGLSRDARLLDLGGWQRSALHGRARRSTFTDRSADPHELTNPREFVAVNLERFLFDPQLACRRPALHRYLSERLGASPQAATCAPTMPFVQADARPDGDAAALLEIDPARVVGIDYLLAEPAGAVMSRWGHGMLRLVVCAPERMPGPDCRLDLEHHRVLSFRAFVDDVQISSWRGLTGSYPSRLFVLPLSQIVDEYTKVEVRGLRSIPLDLSPSEIRGVLEQAAQLHWSYDGRYFFVTNNCAVETWRLLRDGVPRLAEHDLGSLTPTGLLRRLERAGIADASVLGDPDSAKRLGYYFESQRAQYEAIFDAARSSLALPARTVDEWLDLAPALRAPWVERADLRAAAAMLVLEGASLRREEQRARDELKRRLLGRAQTGRSERTQALEALRLADRLTRPAALVTGGYGIPHGAERASIADEASLSAARWREASAHLQREARAWLSPEQRERLASSEDNLARLGSRLRALHRAEGGLDLTGPAR